MTRVVRPAARGCPFWKLMCSVDPVQKISSIVDRPTEIPVEVTEPVCPSDPAARSWLVSTDNTGPEPLLFWSPELVVRESAAMETRASAFR